MGLYDGIISLRNCKDRSTTKRQAEKLQSIINAIQDDQTSGCSSELKAKIKRLYKQEIVNANWP